MLVNMQIDIREEVRSSHVKLGNRVVKKKKENRVRTRDGVRTQE